MRRIRSLSCAVLLFAGCSRQPPQAPDSHSRDNNAANASDRAVLDELNRARRNPVAYSDRLGARQQYYSGAILRLPNMTAIETKEGIAALHEAIAELRTASSLPELTFSVGLSRAARDHVRDQGPKGAVGHDGSDGSTPLLRADRYALRSAAAAEAISYGPSDPELVIAGLLIDDGVPDRGHRRILLDRLYRFGGAACGPHARYRTMCVLDLSPNYAEQR